MKIIQVHNILSLYEAAHWRNLSGGEAKPLCAYIVASNPVEWTNKEGVTKLLWYDGGADAVATAIKKSMK